MPLAEARRLLPRRPSTSRAIREKYVALSLQLLDLYLTFTPDVEPFSVDEAFLGLGPQGRHARAGRARWRGASSSAVDERFGLGASIGVGPEQAGRQDGGGARQAARASRRSTRRASAGRSGRSRCRRCGAWDRSSPGACGRSGSRPSAISPAPPIPSLKAAFGVIGPAAARGGLGTRRHAAGALPRGRGPEVHGARGHAARGLRRPRLPRGHAAAARRPGGAPAARRGLRRAHRDAASCATSASRPSPASACCAASPTTTGSSSRSRARCGARTGRAGRCGCSGVSVSALERARRRSRRPSCSSRTGARTACAKALDRVRDRLGEARVVPAGSLTHRRALGHVPFGARAGARHGEARRDEQPATCSRAPPGGADAAARGARPAHPRRHLRLLVRRLGGPVLSAGHAARRLPRATTPGTSTRSR